VLFPKLLLLKFLTVGVHESWATEFYVVVPDVFSIIIAVLWHTKTCMILYAASRKHHVTVRSTVWNLLHVTSLAPRIWWRLLDCRTICGLLLIVLKMVYVNCRNLNKAQTPDVNFFLSSLGRFFAAEILNWCVQNMCYHAAHWWRITVDLPTILLQHVIVNIAVIVLSLYIQIFI
jgi:hypothetical protein